jgi:hypothetical protein
MKLELTDVDGSRAGQSFSLAGFGKARLLQGRE